MSEGSTRVSRGRRIVLITTCLAVLTVGGAAYWHWGHGPQAALAARAPAQAGVPVSVAIVGRQDVPIYLTRVRTVASSPALGIHSQGHSKLPEGLFTQGQQVTKSG